VRKGVVSLVLVCLLGAVAVGGELSGRFDLGIRVGPFSGWDVVGQYPGRFIDPQATMIVEYYLSGWTFGMVAEFGVWDLRRAVGVGLASIQDVAIKTAGTADST